MTSMPSSCKARGIFLGGLAADGALFDLAVVDAAGLFGKTLTHVVGVGHHVLHGALPHRLHGHGFGCRGSGRRHSGTGGLTRLGNVQVRCRRQLGNDFVATHRALDQTALKLRLVVVFRPKPAFKQVLVSATQVQNLHGHIMGAGSAQCRLGPSAR